MSSRITEEAARRRAFAIISHPDAGKTTLTEKLLLYGGALELAGSVTAKKKQRETSSDWMELEKKRGISISSTLLQFDYADYRLNLLDTPGHKDFSEDTYRVLMAVDAVIMVIDAGKGIENQTRKLFEICRHRGIPIYTFMNKLDRPAMHPLELLDQLEKVLNIHAYPVNWPLENGPFFKGVFDRVKKEVHLFERVPGGAFRAPVSIHGFDDPFVRDLLSAETYDQIAEELELLDGAHEGLDMDAVYAGTTTPVFFGSAANNFGVELLLKGFINLSPEPAPRKIDGTDVPLDSKTFSSFVFKMQTNMNPQHRDRMIFARVCSGMLDGDVKVYNTRNKKEVRISSINNVFGREREVVTESFPGDIIGFITNADFRIGDTLSSDINLTFKEIPRFAPECFAYLSNISLSNYKSFRKGLDHLLAEDIVQAFQLKDYNSQLPLLGAVGPLQFDVLQYRLRDEYGVESNLEMKQWQYLRWIDSSLSEAELKLLNTHNSTQGVDDQGRPVILFLSEWSMQYFIDKNKDVRLSDTPPR